MSGISVIDADGDIQEFADATTWHIDDRGQLHLNSDNGPVASFAKDRWQGAGTSDSAVPAMNAQLAYAAELERVANALDQIFAAVSRIEGQR